MLHSNLRYIHAVVTFYSAGTTVATLHYATTPLHKANSVPSCIRSEKAFMKLKTVSSSFARKKVEKVRREKKKGFGS